MGGESASPDVSMGEDVACDDVAVEEDEPCSNSESRRELGVVTGVELSDKGGERGCDSPAALCCITCVDAWFASAASMYDVWTEDETIVPDGPDSRVLVFLSLSLAFSIFFAVFFFSFAFAIW